MEASTLAALVSFLVFFIFLVKSLVTTSKRANSNSSYSHIPGPKKLPFIGNLHLLLRTSTPHRFFRDLAAKYGPLMHLQLGQVPFVIVSSVETAKQVMKSHDTIFANRPPGIVPEVLTHHYTDVGYAPYGEYWRQLRKICTLELLSVKRVHLFRHIREEENLMLARGIARHEGSPVDLSEKLFMLTFDITTRASVGKKTKEKGTLTPIIRECSKLASGLNVPDLFPSIKILPLVTGLQSRVDRIYRKVQTTFTDIIEEHRAAIAQGANNNTDEDLADVLIKYQQEGDELPLTNGNITAVIMDMFIAGSETSADVVEWTMSELIKAPAVLKKAQEEARKVFDGIGYIDEGKLKELKYLQLVIAETLRLHPPLPFLVPRISSERSEINGYEIPARTTVLINAWALGRDPKHWEEADKYIPERFGKRGIDYKGNSFEYIPFGSGRRICPGMAFGLATVQFTLATLLYHFDWEMPEGIKSEDLDMIEEFGATVARKNHLFLVPTLTRPLPPASIISHVYN